MTVFFVLAAGMVLLAVAWMLVGLFRQQVDHTADQQAVNISIARERQLTLRDALERGDIDQSTYELERADLERALAVDLGTAPAGSHEQHSHRRGDRKAQNGALAAAAIVAVVTPLISGLLYLQLGTPRALDPEFIASTRAVAAGQAQGQAPGPGQEQVPSMASLLPQLEQKLAENPEDATGWALLGRTHLSLGQFEQAIEALQRSDELAPGDAAVLASLAEASAMNAGGALQGDPEGYLDRALQADPAHPQALWLRAIAHQQAGRYDKAVTTFDTLLEQVGTDTEARSVIETMRAESAAALNGTTAPMAPTDAPGQNNRADAGTDASPAPSDAASDSNTGASITVRVVLGPAASAAVTDDQTVFVYARASEGPPMPLAVQRLSVADLPAEVTLDDSMAMMPNMNMSGFKTLTIGARVSATGNAIGEPGDWYTETESVASNTDDTLELTVDRQMEAP